MVKQDKKINKNVDIPTTWELATESVDIPTPNNINATGTTKEKKDNKPKSE